MGTNCAPLVADLFLYCYERDFMDSLNHDNQADVIEGVCSCTHLLFLHEIDILNDHLQQYKVILLCFCHVASL